MLIGRNNFLITFNLLSRNIRLPVHAVAEVAENKRITPLPALSFLKNGTNLIFAKIIFYLLLNGGDG